MCLTDMKAETVAKALEKNIFAHYSPPEVIITDNSVSFKNELIKALCERWNIYYTNIAPYNPQASKVERTFKDVGSALRCR